MKFMGANELRESFISFFESKEHLRMESFPLVPKNDKSLLLINAGMAPLKPYFTGIQKPPKSRVTTCQKCIRTGDIENVGKTSRHGTFFEMLGNFSFGDYFKNEIIPWSWEYVTEVLKLPKDKLYVTIYLEDDEAYEIWTTKTDIDPSRIFRLGKDDNFWEVGTVGPCGPCTEIHYDRGENVSPVTNVEDFVAASDADRIVEFWNLVFIQFDKQEDGSYAPLKNKNIDTGMGLERIATIMQGVDNIFEIDTVKNILNKVSALSGVEYGKDANSDVSLRIVTDHVKAVTMLISDGVQPSNEGRGYVLRRLLRRAARHGRLLGIKGLFLKEIVDAVVENYGGNYPVLVENKDYITKIITLEEERFNETIDSGMNILNGYIKELEEAKSTVLSGEKAFKLYDTYGFPLELTEEILEEKNMTVDHEEFKKEMEAQRERARSARGNMEGESWKEDPLSTLDSSVASNFCGYKHLSTTGVVNAIVKDDEIVDSITEGDKAIIVLDRTTFYAEGGGQVGDSGILENENALFEVITTKKGANNTIKHIGIVKKGSINTKDELKSLVNREIRMASARNHSATHLLHKALKETLGEHVNQAGSLVTPERLRFDITHFEPISKEELDIVERKVNDVILQSLDIDCEVMGINEAKEKGAMALFGEKYGNEVRVVSMGDYSIELCGGTHLNNTSQVGLFKILSEGGVAAGVRRIEAITGRSVYEYLNNRDELIEETCNALKTKEDNLVHRVNALVEENKSLTKELHDVKAKMSLQSADKLMDSKVEVNGVNLVTAKFEDMDMNSLKEMADNLRDKLQSGVVAISNVSDSKVNFVVTATKDVIDRGIHSGNIVKEIAKIAGGKGGGRPNMAQAGATDATKIDEALSYTCEVIKSQVK